MNNSNIQDDNITDVSNEAILYLTGYTTSGKALIGGVWTLRDQEGFPLEMSHVVAQGSDCVIDWAEAMADASISNRCPSLMQQIESFLPADTISHLKMGFMHNVRSGKTFEEIVSEKRANGKKVDSFVQAVAVKLSESARV